MNRIALHLAELRARGKKAFVPFIMAGYPSLDATADLLRGLAAAGADAIEVGIPFSDPLADGPVNQAAAHAALASGITQAGIFAVLRGVTPYVSCPLILFTYLNPVLQRTADIFAAEAAAAGAAGLVIPDLPPEAAGEVMAAAGREGLGVSFLAAPTSPPARVRRAAAASTAFLYAVSLRGVTGERRALAPDLAEFLGRVRRDVDCPVLVGFGIGAPEQARAAAAMADGVIVGSALVRAAGMEGVEAACELASSIRAAV